MGEKAPSQEISAEVRRSRTLPSPAASDATPRRQVQAGATLRPLFWHASALLSRRRAACFPLLPSIFFTPDRNQVAIEHVLDVTGVENMEGYFLGVREVSLCVSLRFLNGRL